MITGSTGAAIGMAAAFAGIYVAWLVHASRGCMDCLNAVDQPPVTRMARRVRRALS